MSATNKKQYSYRQQILFFGSGLLIVLSLLIAVATALVSREQVKDLLFTQGMEWSQSLARNSVVALLYKDADVIRESVKTLMGSDKIDHIELITMAGDVIVQQGSNSSLTHLYPQQHTTAHEFNETNDAWYYSIMVSSLLDEPTALSLDDSDFIGSELLNEQQEELLGYVHIALSKRSLNQVGRQIFFYNLSFAILLSSALIAFLLLLTRKLFMPLESLAGVMEKTSQGSWQTFDESSGPSEIRSISSAYNDMIYGLKQRDEKLREREQNLAITLNSIGDAVIATDAEGMVTRMNPIAEQLTGWTIKEAEGQPLNTIFSILNASTREPIENPIEKVISTGETVYLSNHTTLISRDGTEFQIADSAAPIRSEDDNIQGMVLVFNDVTEQYHLREAAKESDAQVRLLLNSTAEAIYGIDTQGECTFVNQSCLDMLGYKDDSELLGKNMHEIMHYNYQDGTAYPMDKCHICFAVQKEREIHINDEVFWRKDGSHFSAEYWSHPIFKDGVCVGAVVTFLDITDKKQADETIRRTQKMDALGKLTGGIAHDYNNMLGVVLGYSELLQDALSDQPKLVEYIHEINHAGERGAKLTQKLLAFTRQESSAAKSLNINDMLQDEQHMIGKTLTARIKLNLELADDLWPVWLDDGDLEDAILNMSINAMHAIDGNGQLSFQTCNQSIKSMDAELLGLPPGDYVLLRIIDSGSGMSEATRGKIFDPFYSTKGDKGTGLGLSQVYGFVDRSGGAIKVYSELGQGTQFVLYFPRYQQDIDHEEKTEENEAIDFTGTETILVVEDEPALLNLVTEILTQQGYRVFGAERAKQALDILGKENIDLMLSDVIMPEMDGYQLSAIVQQEHPEIKIQLARGFADERHASMVDDSLHQNLLHKPYDTPTLLRRVRALLDDE